MNVYSEIVVFLDDRHVDCNLKNIYVQANYVLGRPVKGTATIAAFPKYKSGYLQPIFQDPHRQVVDISGKVDVEIPVARDLQLLDDYRLVQQID